MFRKKPKPDTERRRPTSSANSSLVFSYHANRSSLPDAEGRTNEAARSAAASRRAQRASWLKRGPVIAGLVVLGLIGLTNLFLGTAPEVVTIGDTRGAIFLRSADTYQQAAQQVLSASVFNKTKLTFNTGHVAKELQAKFPELASVTVSLPFIGRQPTVYIEPAAPRLLLSTLDGSLYVVDNSGRALLAANQVTHLEKLGLPVVTDLSGLAVKPGGTVLPSTSVSFITEVVGQLKAKKLTVTSLTLPAGSSELDVKLNGVGYQVKFNLRGNARVETGAFLAVKQQLENTHKSAQNYIDVRVDDRAYYR